MIKDFAFFFSSPQNDNLDFNKSKLFFESLYDAHLVNTIEDSLFTLHVAGEQFKNLQNNLNYFGNANDIVIIAGEIKTDRGSLDATNKEQIIKYIKDKDFGKFDKYDGDFIIFSFNRDSNEIVLINSKLGLIPCYYYAKDDWIIVSTRLNVFKSLSERFKTNWAAIAQYCLYNYIISDYTFLTDVYTLPPAVGLRIKDEKFSFFDYWNITDEMVDKPLDLSRSIDLLDSTLDYIFKKEVKDKGNVALSLTGGWDGRILLAYTSKYLKKENILLYSFGSNDSPDVFIPKENARNLNYKYSSIDLTSKEYSDNITQWALETIELSDGMRSPRRSHYLYSMDLLHKKTKIVITGIGGSNLIKSGNFKSANVFNRFVLELLQSDNYRNIISKHFEFIKNNYSEIFNQLSQEEFLTSFETYHLKSLFSGYSPQTRMFHFLIGDIERKYFGYELLSYRHLIDSFSPFFDMRFIRALAKTPYFGGYSSGNSFFNTIKSTLLYAKLVNRNAPSLAKEQTDRGFSLKDILFPFNPLAPIKYVKMKKRVKSNNTDHYNNKDILSKVIDKELKGNVLSLKKYPEDEFLANYISTKLFLKNEDDR